MDNENLKYYIKQISFLLKYNAKQAKLEADKPEEGRESYNNGYLMAYHEVIAIMKNQAPVFDWTISTRNPDSKEIIPQSLTRLEFGPRESSRGSTIKKGSILTPIWTPFLSLNPGTLTQPKFQPGERLWYTKGIASKELLKIPEKILDALHIHLGDTPTNQFSAYDFEQALSKIQWFPAYDKPTKMV